MTAIAEPDAYTWYSGAAALAAAPFARLVTMFSWLRARATSTTEDGQ